MFLMIIDSVKVIKPQHIGMKLYADDIKLYTRASKEQGCAHLQDTMRKLDAWSSSLYLKPSAEKCVVLH